MKTKLVILALAAAFTTSGCIVHSRGHSHRQSRGSSVCKRGKCNKHNNPGRGHKRGHHKHRHR